MANSKTDDVVARMITFPKELKEYLEQARKKSMRTFIAEVVYRVNKTMEQEQSQQESKQ